MEQQNKDVSIKEIILLAKDWFTYLISNFKIILICGVLGATIGLVCAFCSKPVYVATLTFALDDEKSSSSLSSALAGQFGLDLGGGSGGGMFAGGNLMELFKSRKMVEKTLLTAANKKNSLADEYIKNSEMSENWQDKPALKNLKFTENPKNPILSRVHDSILGVISSGIITKNLAILQKEKKISIITVEFKDENENFAKKFAETLAKEVSEFYIETKSEKANKNLAILVKQTDSIRGALNGAITGVAVANDNTFGLNPALNVRRVPSARRTVDVQANTAILTELIKQTEIAKVTLRKETPLIQIIDAPILPLPNEKLGKPKGVLFGGFLGGILVLMYLIAKKILKDLIN